MPVVHITSAETALARVTPVSTPSSQRSRELLSRTAHASSHKLLQKKAGMGAGAIRSPCTGDHGLS